MDEIDYDFIAKRREQKREDYLKNRDIYIKRAKEYYLRNKASCSERAIKWNNTHRENRSKINKKYRIKNYTAIRKKATEMRFVNREQINEYSRNRTHQIKLNVFKHYSPDLKCNCCGDNHWEFLTIDHIDGRKPHNHDYGFVGSRLYTWLIKNNFPEGFQVLCMNCNFAKGVWGFCPHTKEVIQTHG